MKKRREYTAQLKQQHQQEVHREYANRTGLGGLDVSGRLSNDNTSEREAYMKRLKQQQYKHELEEQQYADEQRRLYEVEAPLDPSAPLPYMRH